MNLEFYCPRWGSEHLTWDEFMQRVKNAGYDGIEYGIANGTPQQVLDEVWNKAAINGLKLIAQHYDTADSDFAQHAINYERWFKMMDPYKAIKINSQTGKDYFTLEQNKTLFEIADTYTSRSGIPVYHETHRNKFSFAAHITKRYLEEIPSLKITLDMSHWVNVAESYLEDQQEAINLAVSRTEHIHARVGYPEGPQITDPRAPEWSEALQVHLAVWQKVVNRKKLEGKDTVLTIAPEFGPFPYLVHLPFTQQPITSQWEINEYMMNLLKEQLDLK